MKKAIEKTVYFSNSGNNYTKVAELEYTDKQSLSEVIHSLPNNIDIVRFFEPRDNICYTIFNDLEDLFERIFLDQVNSIYLVNGRDRCIQINRLDEITKEPIYAIIKLDSVLAKYYKIFYKIMCYK